MHIILADQGQGQGSRSALKRHCIFVLCVCGPWCLPALAHWDKELRSTPDPAPAIWNPAAACKKRTLPSFGEIFQYTVAAE